MSSAVQVALAVKLTSMLLLLAFVTCRSCSRSCMHTQHHQKLRESEEIVKCRNCSGTSYLVAEASEVDSCPAFPLDTKLTSSGDLCPYEVVDVCNTHGQKLLYA